MTSVEPAELSVLPVMYRFADVAQAYGMDVRTLKNYVKVRHLSYKRLGHQRWFDRAQFAAFMASLDEAAPAAADPLARVRARLARATARANKTRDGSGSPPTTRRKGPRSA